MISEQAKQRMRDLAARYPVARSAIMPAFYTMYYQQQPGKKVIKVCTSISCYLRGCDAVVDHFEKRLGIKHGETSADGNYTFLTTECLASCGTAPVLQVNNEFVEHLTLEMVDALVDEWDRELGRVAAKGVEPETEIRL